MNFIKLLNAVKIIESSISECPDPKSKEYMLSQCRQTINWLREELKDNQRHQSTETNPLAASWVCPDCRKTLPHTVASKRCGKS